MKEKIKTALLTAKGGFVNCHDAAIWLMNYPSEKYSGNEKMMVAFLRGSTLLFTEMDRRHGAPKMIPVTEPIHMQDGTIDHRIIPGAETRAEREDNADYRRDAQQVSIDLLRAAAVADSNALLVSLIDDAVTEQRRILGHSQPQAAPVVTASAAIGVEPAQTGPQPLTTGDIAFCLAGLRWDEEGWKKPLGDKPKWLDTCLVLPGTRGRGGSPRLWNPVLICAALVRDGHAQARSVRAKFQVVHLLQPWLETWKTYEADNFQNE